MSTFKLLPGLGMTVVLLGIADAFSYVSSYASSSGATTAPTSEQ
jgi:hypothetical protein